MAVYPAPMKFGIIGCGKMGTALVQGAVQAGVIDPGSLRGVDPHPAARESFVQATGGTVGEDIASLADCDVVLLCTKPQDARTALGQLADSAGSHPILVVSVAAGVSLAQLEAEAGDSIRVIRCMPNTPALVGKGAAAYCLGMRADEEDARTAERLLGSVGLAFELPECLMDAVTGLSGSGPAYVYLMIEALADGGVKQGLARPEALKLAAQTVHGAASMVIETGEHPAVLKDMVTSPGGTTIAGLSALERGGFRAALMEAVAAAAQRSAELRE